MTKTLQKKHYNTNNEATLEDGKRVKTGLYGTTFMTIIIVLKCVINHKFLISNQLKFELIINQSNRIYIHLCVTTN